MQDTEDLELLAALEAGSEFALKALYERHRRAVYAQAYAETGERADAEEMLQDTFLTLWQKNRRVRLVGGSALPWLLVTAKNLSRNRRRYQKRRITVQAVEAAAGDHADPSLLAEQAELKCLLSEALGQLDPLDRQVIELCLIDGLSYQQAAVQVGSTHGSVRNRLSRARKATREKLATVAEREMK